MIINVCSCELLDNLDHAYEILALADIIRSQFEGKWPFPLHCGHSNYGWTLRARRDFCVLLPLHKKWQPTFG